MKTKNFGCFPGHGERGFSLLELLVVMVVIAIVSIVSIASLTANKKAYATDNRALEVLDFMRDASVQALSKRRTFRLEIDYTDNRLELIDENGAGVLDDRMVRWLPLNAMPTVLLDQTPPTGISTNGLPAGYTNGLRATDNIGHQRGGQFIVGHDVWMIRFRSDGSLVGQNGAVASAALYFWSSKPGQPLTTPDSKNLVCAITLFGPTGGLRYWRYKTTQFVAG